jgi:hypothetical protein
LQSSADSIGFAVARNDQTRYKTFWAMVIADKSPKNSAQPFVCLMLFCWGLGDRAGVARAHN